MTQGRASHPDLPADLEAAVALGSEMGRRFAEFDWAAHPLGRPQDWPAEMRTIVAAALTSRFPMALFLGRRRSVQIYNDAYIPILGDKHPAALGRAARKCGGTSGTSIGPLIASVTATGKAVWSDDLCCR